jgi:hypothetical protein
MTHGELPRRPIRAGEGGVAIIEQSSVRQLPPNSIHLNASAEVLPETKKTGSIHLTHTEVIL